MAAIRSMFGNSAAGAARLESAWTFGGYTVGVHPPELPGVTHRYYDLATGVRAHVAHAGDESKPPLVALHGFPQHWYEWRRVIERLDGEFHILAMDLRGLGWTSKAPDRDYRKATIAADVIALLDALEIERAGLVAHDWGGWVGWHAVLAYPERFTGYVATGIVHPWNSTRTMLRELPRFLYQPPIAAPVLGPWLVPHVVTRILRAAWGDRTTYDKAAEPIYGTPTAIATRASTTASSSPTRSCAGRGPADAPDAAAAGPQGPDRDGDGHRAWSATATTPARSCSRAAGISSRRSGPMRSRAPCGSYSASAIAVSSSNRSPTQRGSGRCAPRCGKPVLGRVRVDLQPLGGDVDRQVGLGQRLHRVAHLPPRPRSSARNARSSGPISRRAASGALAVR